LIVDDEPLAIERLQILCARTAGVSLVGTATDGAGALRLIEALTPDLLLLDIQMPGMDGMALAGALAGRASRPALIFVTAFDQHALRAFEVQALDYLLKPFDRARFQKALGRARAHIRQNAGAALDPRLTHLLDSLGNRPRPTDRVVIKSAGRIMFLRTDEIDWVEAADNYVRLHVGPESHLLRETMGSLETRLDPTKFMRIHRSTVVNIDRLKELQPWFHGDYIVTLQDGTRLNLSRTYRDRVIDLLGEIF